MRRRGEVRTDAGGECGVDFGGGDGVGVCVCGDGDGKGWVCCDGGRGSGVLDCFGGESLGIHCLYSVGRIIGVGIEIGERGCYGGNMKHSLRISYRFGPRVWCNFKYFGIAEKTSKIKIYH